MSATRYHLVCDGFRNPSANKTQLSLALKHQLALTDAQLADLMASRSTVLARNLGKEKAQELGRKLIRAGLSIKVETAQINQKISAGELRDHLRDGGLSHYFAGRYHHPEEDIDTRISLLILAALPVFSYAVLPLIGLALGLPLLDLTVWLEQTLAATTQGLLAALCWVPLFLFRPRSSPAAGVKLDAETESLAFELVDEISHYINAPQVASIRLTHSPFLRIHQTHWLWLRRQTDLEIGLPYLETLTLQQFAGDLILQLAPLAPRFHSWTWGLYLSWHQTVAARFPRLIHRLDAFVQPMHEHQQLRQDAMVQALIGHKEARRVRQINQRLLPIVHQWGEFEEFCRHLDATATEWGSWIGRTAAEAVPTSDIKESVGQFRMTAPASWILTHPAGYNKALTRQNDTRAFSETAVKLWRQFQVYKQAMERFRELGVPAAALIPPTAEHPGAGPARARSLIQGYQATLKAQRDSVRYALGLAKQEPKQGVSLRSRAWREAAQPFWPAQTTLHRNHTLARTLYLALQSAEQINLWARQKPGDDAGRALRERQLNILYQRWARQLGRLPALPLLSQPPATLKQQLLSEWTEPELATAEAIAGRAQDWVNVLQIYWTLVAASLLNSQIRQETQQAAA